MLTPEQTRMRIYDIETRELKRENAALKEKISTARMAMANMLRELAKYMSNSDAAELRDMADDLEA